MEPKEPGTNRRGGIADAPDVHRYILALRALLFTDGGARLNPGLAGIGVVLLDERGEILGEVARPIGVATNNVAEYTALIEGLKLALDRGVTHVDIQVDSPVVAGHLLETYRVKSDRLRALIDEVKTLLERFEGHTLRREPRAENVRADRLANAGMDASTASMFTIHLDLLDGTASATCARCLEQGTTSLSPGDMSGSSLWKWMVAHAASAHPSKPEQD